MLAKMNPFFLAETIKYLLAVSGVDGLLPLACCALGCRPGGRAATDGCQPHERGTWYLCRQEGKKAGGMEAEGGRKQAGRNEKSEGGKKIDFERRHKMMWHQSAPTRQKSPPIPPHTLRIMAGKWQIPLVMLKDVCLGAMMKTSTSKVFFSC